MTTVSSNKFFSPFLAVVNSSLYLILRQEVSGCTVVEWCLSQPFLLQRPSSQPRDVPQPLNKSAKQLEHNSELSDAHGLKFQNNLQVTVRLEIYFLAL